MKVVTCFFLLCLLFLAGSLAAQPYRTPGNKVLVVSGGGSRGAWGLGVARSLSDLHGPYRAVFGTSTGSLMAPMILLQQFDDLEKFYGSVTQDSIFNKNPFKVRKLPDGKLTTELKSFNAIWRLITAKPTLGETENLRNLIKQAFTEKDFNRLRELHALDGLSLNVAVTNLTSGEVKIKSTEDPQNYSYEEMVTWIWASANQPIFMSYVTVGDSTYVDGGLREIVPLRKAVEYAFKHNIDTVDVIVNDQWEPQDKSWSVTQNKGYFKGGLMRVLEVYNSNTLYYDIRAGELLSELIDATNSKRGPGRKPIVAIIYSMPKKLAVDYKDDLGFRADDMKYLILEGKKFITVPTYVDDTTRYICPRPK